MGTRHGEVEQLLDRATAWAAARPDVCALALIGSWATGRATAASDVDLLLLSDDPALYIEDDGWAAELGASRIVKTAAWGVITERRLAMPSGLEVEVGVGRPAWADTSPVDAGTMRVVREGMEPLHDPHGLLARLRAAARS